MNSDEGPYSGEDNNPTEVFTCRAATGIFPFTC